MNTVRANFDTLKTLRKKLAVLENSRAQVGLFEDTAGRSTEAGRVTDNPTLGFLHEFGDTNLPARSWLRLPLWVHLGPVVEAKGTSWLWMLMNRGVRRTLALLGAMAEDVVQEGFATGGFGNWTPLAPSTIRRKKSSAILIETAQMRKAVSSRVI